MFLRRIWFSIQWFFCVTMRLWWETVRMYTTAIWQRLRGR